MKTVRNVYPGDAILKNDIKFMQSISQKEKTYIMYPSRDIPRFIIPVSDIVAQRFIIRMMSADQGAVGFFMRVLASIPGGVYILRASLFRDRLHIG